MTTSPVDSYLADVPPEHRPALEALRRIIRATVPDVEEMIRVGVPAFKIRGRALASIGSASGHVALYLMYSSVIADHAELLAGYETSKTVVRLDPSDAPPEALVGQLLRARLAELGMSDATSAPPDLGTDSLEGTS